MLQRPRRSVLCSSLILLAVAVTACDTGIRTSDGIPSLDTDRLQFGRVRVGESKRLTARLTNAGTGDLGGIRVTATNLEAYTVSKISETLGSGAQIVVTVIFTPPAVGAFNGSLLIETDATIDPDVTLTIEGEGVERGLEVGPASLDFGVVEVGTRRDLQIELTNEAPIAEEAVTVAFGDTRGDFEIEPAVTFPMRIEPGEKRIVKISFAPVRAGAQSSELAIRTCDTCDERSIGLVARAVESFVELDPKECIDFGKVNPGSSVTRSVRVKNLGEQPLAVQDAVVVGGAPFALAHELPTQLGQDASTTLDVTFTPTAIASFQGLLEVTTDNARRPKATICLKGEGGGPDIDVTPTTLSFGTVAVGNAKQLRVTVANIGFDPLNVSGVRFTGPSAAEFHSNFTSPAQIPVGGSRSITVEYRPVDDGNDSATIEILSDDVDEPVSPVSLVGLGRDLPACDLQVNPAEATGLNFGNVQLGRTSTLTIGLTNAGATDCLITDFGLEAGSATFGLPNGGFDERLLAPGETYYAPVTFTPTDEASFSGGLSFTVNHEESPYRRIRLSGASAAGCLFIQPDDLNFGVVGAQCSSRDRTITIYSGCVRGSVDIRSVQLAGAAGQPFVISGVPALPAKVSGANSFSFRVRYSPQENGEHFGAVLIETSEGPAPYNIGLRGRADDDAVQLDTFAQERRPTVDVLFVIDNSGSMSPYQQTLANNFGNFIQFATEQDVDYRLGVTSTDVRPNGEAGRLVPSTGTQRWLTPESPNLARAFAERVTGAYFAGGATGGSADEQGLEGMRLALTNTTENANFIRYESFLSVVIVSDEPDSSPLGVMDYYNVLLGTKNQRPNMFSVSSVAMVGSSYEFITNYTNGKFTDIQQADWSASLKAFGAEAFGFKTRFHLTSQPAPGSLEVMIDGQPVPEWLPLPDGSNSTVRQWHYDATSNAVVFSPIAIPEPGNTLEVSYTVSCVPPAP